MASTTGAPPLLRSLLLGLCVVFLAFNFSGATEQTERIVAVVGTSECFDCAQKSIENEEAFKGLHVAIQCKTGDGFHETKGVGLLDKSGSFDVQLPSNVLRDDGELKDECFAQLRDASEAPCPDNNGLDQSKIVPKSKDSGKHTFVVAAGKLPFSSTCTSAVFHKDFKHKFDFHHPDYHHKHYFPHKKHFPPVPVDKFHPDHPKLKFPVVRKKPLPIFKKPQPPIPEQTAYHPPSEFEFPIHKKPLLPIHKHLHDHLHHPEPKLPLIHKKPLPPIHKLPLYHPDHPDLKFPPKPKFYKKKLPTFPPVKEQPIP